MALNQVSIPYGNTAYPHAYLCSYLPVSVRETALSQSLLKFKRGLQPDRDAWVGCSLEMLEECPPTPGSVIVRALHHWEMAVSPERPASLDLLGAALAARFECFYLPGLLCKRGVTREIKGSSKAEREVELMGVYYIKEMPSPDTTDIASPGSSDLNGLRPLSSGEPDPLSILIIDDIFTTGTTIRTIMGTLLPHYPQARLRVFTLAKADYSADQFMPLKGQNRHAAEGPIPAEGTAWMVEEDPAPYSSLPLLRDFIRNDAFPG